MLMIEIEEIEELEEQIKQQPDLKVFVEESLTAGNCFRKLRSHGHFRTSLSLG